MTWFRLDDGFHDNAKVLEASNAAVGVWTKCMTWSAHKNKDGFVPRGAALALAKGDQAALDELVAVRLLVVEDGGYRAPDFLKYNPSAEMVERQREAKVGAGRRGANARWGQRPAAPAPTPAEPPAKPAVMAPAMAPVIAPAMADGRQSDAPDPVPVPPKPPYPLPPAGEGGTPEGLSARPVGPWSLRPGDPDPEAFADVLARRGGGALHTGMTPGLGVELGERLWSIFATGRWSMADAPIAADFAAAGGLRAKRGKKPGVDWLVRNNGVNLLWLLEAARDWDRAGRPLLDGRGVPVPTRPPAPVAAPSPASGAVAAAKLAEMTRAKAEFEARKAAAGGGNVVALRPGGEASRG